MNYIQCDDCKIIVPVKYGNKILCTNCGTTGGTIIFSMNIIENWEEQELTCFLCGTSELVKYSDGNNHTFCTPCILQERNTLINR